MRISPIVQRTREPGRSRQVRADFPQPNGWGRGDNIGPGALSARPSSRRQQIPAIPARHLTRPPQNPCCGRSPYAGDPVMTEQIRFPQAGSDAASAHAVRLDRLAEVAVKVGLGLVPGQQLVMTASVEALPLVRRITEHAYKAGASIVTTLFADEEATLARFRHAPDGSFDKSTNWLFDG